MKKFTYPEEPGWLFKGAHPSHGFGGSSARNWSYYSTLTIYEVAALTFGMNPYTCESFWEDKSNYGTLHIGIWEDRLTEIIRAVHAGEIRTAGTCTEINKDTLVHTVDVENYFKPRRMEPKEDNQILGETERKTMLKIILGMAIHAYSYDPSSKRNAATGSNKNSISSALQSLGLDISEDTIRKYLDEAKEHFSTSSS
ncbi:hypothetical protein [Legionella sp. CNM-4043-24]|uniref:hypothetical protein n=1 Tax=Legionella sp. CNM-4043-24 TaxID=3421646 RepID=UPI00403A8579